MKIIFILLCVLAAGYFPADTARAQILMSGGTYSQNFDSLANSGSPSWTDNSTLPGWYISKAGGTSGNGPVTSYTPSTGSSGTGAIYCFGASGSTERALGSIASATPGNFAYGVSFTNDTGFVQSNITVSYMGEQWRNGGNTGTQILAFSFLVSGSPITNSDAVNANTWTAFTTLDFTTPTTGSTAGALDGNNPANQQVFTNVVLPAVVQPGQEIFLRWFDTNDSGTDHGVAIDNLTVGFSASTNSPATNSPPPVTPPAVTQARTLRIVTYNIEADVGVTTPLPGLIAPPGNPANVQAGGVLEGIGEELLNGNAQPLDVLALEETTSNSITVAPIVAGLNSFYGVAGMYSSSPYQATQFGGSDNTGNGNGPNAMVYNTKTLQLLASVPVDPPGGVGNLGSASGEYREVMRYEFAPAGVAPTATNEFYIYVSHYKASIGTANENYRLGEAQIIRNDEANNLPANSRVIYVGDYNMDRSGEPGYQTILSNTAPNGISQGQGVDPLNPTNNRNINWSASTTDTNILVMLTENSAGLQYRDDLQLMTTNVYYGAPGGLKYIFGTYHVFGNSGTAYYGSVNSGTNTALINRLVTNGPVFISAAQLYLDLTNASDHLPVVADYAIPLPVPVISRFSLAGTNLVLKVANCITGGVFTVLTSTNISLPLTNWTALAITSTATGGSFTLTATNAVNPAAPRQFYLLQEK